MNVFGAFRSERLVDKIIAIDNPENEESKKLAAKLESRGPSAIPLIIDALEVAGKPHTVMFVDILTKLLNSNTLPLYIEGLKHPNERVVTAVAWVLTSDGHYDPNALIETLDDDGVPKAVVLDLISHHRKRIKLTRLMQHAYNLDPNEKTGVFKIIGELADDNLVPDLIARATGKDPFIRTHIINILGRFNRADVQDALQNQLTDKNKDVREAALDALVRMDAGPVNIKMLTELLLDPDLGVQQKAIDVIVKVNHPETAKYLIDALKDESEYARRAAVEVLNEIGTPESIKQLLEAVQDEDWWVRARAADALAKIGGPKVVNAVLELIKDDDESIRRAAIEILNSIKDPRSMKHLISALEDSDWWVRERAVDALAEIGNKKAVPALLGMLGKHKESDPVIIRALAKLGDHRIIDAIIDQLNRPEKTVKVEALAALAKLSDERHADKVREAIVGQATAKQPEVGQAAKVALKELDRRVTAIQSEESTIDTAEALQVAALEGGAETHTLLIEDQELEKALAESRVQRQLDISVLEPGDMVADRYRYVQRIGKGAFGTVLLMEDTAVEEKIILKFLNAQIAADDEMMKRFVYELRYSRKITHPNVIRIFDFLDLGGQYAISMEYFPSHTLGAEIVDSKPMALERAIRFACDIAGGMTVAHKVGVVHRDLKPPNILINEEGILKIVDFGVAAAHSSGDTQLTKTGYVIGSPKYMAPEQILGKKVDHLADIYSLGVILYEMVTGRPPYVEGDHMAVMYAHVQGNAETPHSVNPDLPMELSELVQKAMARHKEERFQSMLELKASLETMAGQLGAA